MVKMDSPAECASCAMSTAGKYNQSVAGTTHPLVVNVCVRVCVEVDVILWQNGWLDVL